MNRQSEYVLREVDDHDVRFIRLWFTDITGTLKSVAIAPAELEAAFEGGISFDGSAVEGLTRGHESDMVMRPDPSTFQLLSWGEDGSPSARMFCSIYTPDGEPARSDPRAVLERALDRAASMGFSFYAQPECEFYLFHPTTDEHAVPIPIDNGSYFDHVTRSIAQSFRSRAVKRLEDMGITVEFSHHEIGPGQNEIDLRRSDALTMADQIMTLRVVVEQVAISQGVMASFMPKPIIDAAGSAMHTHFSLFEGNKNAFYDPLASFHLSATGRKFVAGLLHHAPQITAITNQHVNSYKRLWAGYEAPNYVSWGNSHTSLVRIPALVQGDPESARVEYRALDSAANPYLAFAVILNAGLAGIEEGYDLPEDLDVDVSELTDLECRAIGLRALPASLSDALKEMRQSELVADTLGEDAFAYFLRNKHHEWEAYRHQVTPFERRAFMTSN